jgi:heptosyltransferase-3
VKRVSDDTLSAMATTRSLYFRLTRFFRRLGQLMPSMTRNIVKFSVVRLRNLLIGRHLVVIGLIEHMGDIVACEPIAQDIRRRYPDGYVTWVVRREFVDLLIRHPALDAVWTVTCLTEWIMIRRLLGKKACLDLHFHRRRCAWFGFELDNPNQLDIDGSNYYSQGRTLLEAYCVSGRIPVLQTIPALHMPESTVATKIMDGIEVPLVVMHCTSNEVERNWPAESFSNLSAFLLARGWSVVEIGLQKRIKVESDRFHDLCGKLDLAGYATVIQRATLFIGVDSGFAHFSKGATRLPRPLFGVKWPDND